MDKMWYLKRIDIFADLNQSQLERTVYQYRLDRQRTTTPDFCRFQINSNLNYS